MIDIGCGRQIDGGEDAGDAENLFLRRVVLGHVAHQAEHHDEQVLHVEHQLDIARAGGIGRGHRGEGEGAGEQKRAERQAQHRVDQARAPEIFVGAGHQEGQRHTIEDI